MKNFSDTLAEAKHVENVVTYVKDLEDRLKASHSKLTMVVGILCGLFVVHVAVTTFHVLKFF